MGYASSQKGYKCLHIPTNKIYVSRHIVFDEYSFPFKHDNTTNESSLEQSSFLSQLQVLLPTSLPTTSSPISEEQPFPEVHEAPSDDQHHIPDLPAYTTASGPPAGTTSPINAPNARPLIGPSSTANASSSSHAFIQSSTISLPCSQQPASVQPNQQLVPTSSSTHSMITRTKDNTRKVKDFSDFVALTASLDSEPTTFRQANSHPEWRQAMATEINALAANQTWTLVPSSSNQNIIGCKWVFKIKRHSNGQIERYKARLVAKGFNQEEGIDYHDTFSPVIRPTTIRLILSLAVSHGWLIKQLDVQNAFLHGDLKETVFMSQPPGFVDSTKPNHVCKLTKSLYGLKQSPRAWFHKLSEALLSFGFQASQHDPSLFFTHKNSHILILLVYVDDIIITASNPDVIQSCISFLQTKFALKDLGSLHYFLGIAVTNFQTGLYLSQAKYITDLLTRTNMLHSKPCTTPISTSAPLSKFDGLPFEDPKLYRSIVGALHYATITRPDITFAVNKVSQFMQAPTNTHWADVKRILRYLNGTILHGLHFQPSPNATLHAYTDADWAGCPDDRRSTSGFCIFLGCNIVS